MSNTTVVGIEGIGLVEVELEEPKKLKYETQFSFEDIMTSEDENIYRFRLDSNGNIDTNRDIVCLPIFRATKYTDDMVTAYRTPTDNYFGYLHDIVAQVDLQQVGYLLNNHKEVTVLRIHHDKSLSAYIDRDNLSVKEVWRNYFFILREEYERIFKDGENAHKCLRVYVQ